MSVRDRFEGRLSAKSRLMILERRPFTPKLPCINRSAAGQSQEAPPAADKFLLRRPVTTLRSVNLKAANKRMLRRWRDFDNGW
jgi:hypothetical protein